MDKRVVLVVKIIVVAGKEAEFQTVVKTLIEESRKEAGCICYDLHQNFTKPNEYWLIEIWQDEKIVLKHTKTEHYKKISPKFAGVADFTLTRATQKL